MTISQKRGFVAERAGYICEYCLAPLSYSLQPFVVEHIIPISKNGTNDLDNLACSCGGYNGYKYNKTTVIDPASGMIASLYHPRQQLWSGHFSWNGDYSEIVGLSPEGRATVQALRLNRQELINLRMVLVLAGKHPPVKKNQL